MGKYLIAVAGAAVLVGCSSSGKLVSTGTVEATTTVASAVAATTTASPAVSDVKAATATVPKGTVAVPVTAAVAVAPTAPPSTPAPTEPPTTPAVPAKGTVANPFTSADMLKFGDYSPVVVTVIEPVTDAQVKKGNQFNDPAPAGQMYVRIGLTVTYTGTTKSDGGLLSTQVNLVGMKGKLYERTFVSGGSGGAGDDLKIFSDEPDVITGGKITGFIYYLADSDDATFLAAFNSPSDGSVQFVKPG